MNANGQRKNHIAVRCALLYLLPLALYSSDWPVYKGNLYFTGNNDELIVKSNLLRWVYRNPSALVNPIVSDGRIYLLDIRKNLICLDEETGRIVWRVNMKEISARFRFTGRNLGKIKYPLIHDDRLIVSDSTVIYCFDKRTGKVIWARTGMQPVKGAPRFAPTTGEYSGDREVSDRERTVPDRIDRERIDRGDSTQPFRFTPPFAGGHNSTGNRRSREGRSGPPGVRGGEQKRYERRPFRVDPNKGLSHPLIDGIYSDPVIVRDLILYGTRRIFMARAVENGGLIWHNQAIRSYSAFPTFYDRYVFTQSMNYQEGSYTVFCLERTTGKTIWSSRLPKPYRILAPVVYRRRVYIPVGESLYALDLRTGKPVWSKKYEGLITSFPSFTDREIVLTLDNRDIAVVSPDDGALLHRKSSNRQVAPRYVTIRDQIYLAATSYRKRDGKRRPYTRVVAANLNSDHEYWEFHAPFDGEPSQPTASGGVLFLPAGNHLYALGKAPVDDSAGRDYVVHLKRDKGTTDGQSDRRQPKGGEAKGDGAKGPERSEEAKKATGEELKKNARIPPGAGEKLVHRGNPRQTAGAAEREKRQREIPLRDLKIKITDKENRPLDSRVTVRKRHNGEIVFEKVHTPGRGEKTIRIPDDDGVEILVEEKNHLPNKIRVNRKDKMVHVVLTPVRRGESLVLQTIEFEFNSAYLRRSSLDVLDRIAAVLRKRPTVRLQIEGHTDSVGGNEYNQRLSEKRAEAVADYFVKQGISPARLETAGYGEQRPLGDNRTPEGRARNRRTELKIMAD